VSEPNTHRLPVTVIVVTHNSAGLVGPVLEALFNDPTGPDEVIVVDNASSDDTRWIVDQSDARLTPLDQNLGFVGGCHRGAAEATHPTLVFLGHDTIPRDGWLVALAAAVEDETVGAAMATIEQHHHPGRFNTSGGHLAYHGLAWVSDLDRPIPPEEDTPIDVAFPSGAAMAMTKQTWRRFGGFRQGFFMYHEDSDLGWRLRLAGLRVVRAPTSRVAHDYDFSRSPGKLFWLERNRLLMLRTNYRTSTLLLLSPALAVVEGGVWVVAARDGWLGEKARSVVAAFRARSTVRPSKAEVQSQRRIGDSAMLSRMDATVGAVRQIAAPRGVGLVDRFLIGFLRLVLPAVRLVDRRDSLPTI
jgi:GT2 family glycosyltransferase